MNIDADRYIYRHFLFSDLSLFHNNLYKYLVCSYFVVVLHVVYLYVICIHILYVVHTLAWKNGLAEFQS